MGQLDGHVQGARLEQQGMMYVVIAEEVVRMLL